MTQRGDRARLEGQQGFSLIELSVVLLVIAVLVGISLSSFRGATRARELSAIHQRAMAGLKAEMVLQVSTGFYLGTAAEERRALLRREEPSIDWGSVSSTNDEDLTVRVGRLSFAGRSYRQSWICLEATTTSGEHAAVANVSIGPARGTYYSEGSIRLCRGMRSFTAWPTTSW
ncbi:MAG: prepilin-type N-terminal cleavage/methylation domain-containing protein [Actinomycetota bacterium]